MLSKAFLVSLLGFLATAHPTSIDIVFNAPIATDVCPIASGFFIPTSTRRLYKLSCATDMNIAMDIKTRTSTTKAQTCAQACEDYDKSGTCTGAVYNAVKSKCHLKSGTLKMSGQPDGDALIRTDLKQSTGQQMVMQFDL